MTVYTQRYIPTCHIIPIHKKNECSGQNNTDIISEINKK